MRRGILLFFAIFAFPCMTLGQGNEKVFFSDSNTGNEFYDSSWGYKKSPSFLELAGSGKDKFPVDPQHPYKGAHSLRLRWISQSGGDWGIALASLNWQPIDFTQYDTIVYWINAPEAINQDALPDLAIEDITNKKSTRIWLGDFFGGVDGDSTTWQRVAIPINAFQPGPQNADFTRIKTIFHYQKNADGVEHVAWVDEFRLIKAGGSQTTAPAAPQNLQATGYDSRIDLKWDPNSEPDLLGYFVYRAQSPGGPFVKVNSVAHKFHMYSDFVGENGKTYYYRVTAVNQNYVESDSSAVVNATPVPFASDEELLTSVQEATFRYFWDFGHPVSGLARERDSSGDVCTTGGTGFGLLTLMVGAERGFAPRDSIVARILKILRFMQEQAKRYHGAWSHWINGSTGETIPFSAYDNGGDLVETAYFVQGLLAIRQYFDGNSAEELELRQRATQLWEEVEWDWYRRTSTSKVLYWHWSPDYGWIMNMPIQGWNEAMIVYLLAIASPTHPVPASMYYDGWAGSSNYVNGNVYYGYKQFVGPPYGGPLFFTHYSFLGFDPRGKSDRFCNYFENNRNTTLINRAYCIANPEGHKGYSDLVWGLTSSDDPGGYSAHEPTPAGDNGTITPTAAISAMPYTPDESIATLKHFYYTYGPKLWGEFGFRDAFNLDNNWFANSYLAIDQGTIVPMIENYRTELCWRMFMANPEIDSALAKIGWTVTDVEENPAIISEYSLEQNYPNPFNSETIISFSIPREERVTVEVINARGQIVAVLLPGKKMKRGHHRVVFAAKNLSSGVYFYRLRAEHFQSTRKLLLLR